MLVLVLTEPFRCRDRRNCRIDIGFGKSSVPLNCFFIFRRIYLIPAVLIISDFLSCAVYLPLAPPVASLSPFPVYSGSRAALAYH